MNKDTVVGIVGAVILLAAMVGVFKYEGSQAQSSLGSQSFDATWAPLTVNGPTVEETTAFQQTTTSTVEVSQTNLTKVQFTVTWTAQNGQDTLSVTVTPPGGSGIAAQSAEEADGSITLTFDVPNDTPPETTVFGNSEDDARARLAAQHTKSVGTGNWTIEVEFTEASGVITIPGGPPVQPDEQVTWTGKTQLTHYVPKLASR